MPETIAKPTVRLHHGDCLEFLRTLEPGSVDAVVTDPPYPEIDRPYGRMTEAEWHVMMRGVVEQVQDAWWWNVSAPPTVHCQRQNGLMRGSVKACVWLGDYDCYRNQDAVLWTESDSNKAKRQSSRSLQVGPSGLSMRPGRCCSLAEERGGSTPFNLIPIANTDSSSSAGSHGHGAGTPYDLADWWTRYISPEDGVVCDPFLGSGTMGLSAINRGRSFVGCERDANYFAIAKRRIDEASCTLF